MDRELGPSVRRLFAVAGERSGDRHGAGLLEELRALHSGLSISGLGGPEMSALAAEVTDWVEDAAVVGIVDVLRNYPWFRRQFAETLRRIAEFQPDAVLLIDYPGFNLRLAKALRASGFAGKITYYISPQVWAWHRGRIPKMARWLDLMVCIFPFEKDLYRGHGLPTIFAGHPLVGYHRKRLLGLRRENGLIGLFPGSRRREISRLFPVMLEAARLMRAADPSLRFVASAASPRLAAMMEQMTAATPVDGLTIETGTAYAMMQRVECGVVASGTATLEAAVFELPHCLVYKVAWGTYVIAKAVIKVPFLGIINILAGHEVVKELLQQECLPETIAAELTRLHSKPEARRMLTMELRLIIDGLAGDEPYARAAEAISTLVGGQDPDFGKNGV